MNFERQAPLVAATPPFSTRHHSPRQMDFARIVKKNDVLHLERRQGLGDSITSALGGGNGNGNGNGNNGNGNGNGGAQTTTSQSTTTTTTEASTTTTTTSSPAEECAVGRCGPFFPRS